MSTSLTIDDNTLITGPAQQVGKGLVTLAEPMGSPERTAKYILEILIEKGVADEYDRNTGMITVNIRDLPKLKDVHPLVVLQAVPLLGTAMTSILGGKDPEAYFQKCNCDFVPPDNSRIAFTYALPLDADKVKDDLVEYQDGIEAAIPASLKFCTELHHNNPLSPAVIGHG